MKTEIKLFWFALLIHGILSFDLHQDDKENENPEVSTRGRRDVIEEEKYYNMRSDTHQDGAPWLPGLSEDPTTKISLTNDHLMYQTTETVTDKPVARGARASKENWIKLPLPNREESRDIQPQPQELINSRMPRVNFITQKVLDASESRIDKGSIQRPSYDLRTEFEDRKPFKPVYSRQAVYYERPYYEDRYPSYRLDTHWSPGYGDRHDEYDNYISRKPKRIIYYAHLPDVIRTPPSVDLRYRYDPYRPDDYRYRYDYRYRNRYPMYERFGYRDQSGSGTVVKEKKDEKVTPTPILPKKEDVKINRNPIKNVINSHQYHDPGYNDITQKSIRDHNRSSDSYLRFEEPLFSTMDDPYKRKY